MIVIVINDLCQHPGFFLREKILKYFLILNFQRHAAELKYFLEKLSVLELIFVSGNTFGKLKFVTDFELPAH
jgi:hypothetical protein